MPSHGGFALTQDDVAILRHIFNCRLVRAEHLSALLDRSPEKIRARLVKLIARHYVLRITLPQQKHIYRAARAGIHKLVEQGLAPQEVTERRLRDHELKPLGIDHQMMVVDVHVGLAAGATAAGLRLATWREGSALWDRVKVRGERDPLPVRPDGFFVLEDPARPSGANRRNFFLEADRSTEDHPRFRRKLQAYAAYFEQKLHRKRYDITGFNVVTVTKTPERAWNLCELAEDDKTLPPAMREHYYFAPGPVPGDPAPLFGEAFLTPHDFRTGRRHALVPRLATASARAHLDRPGLVRQGVS